VDWVQAAGLDRPDSQEAVFTPETDLCHPVARVPEIAGHADLFAGVNGQQNVYHLWESESVPPCLMKALSY